MVVKMKNILNRILFVISGILLLPIPIPFIFPFNIILIIYERSFNGQFISLIIATAIFILSFCIKDKANNFDDRNLYTKSIGIASLLLFIVVGAFISEFIERNKNESKDREMVLVPGQNLSVTTENFDVDIYADTKFKRTIRWKDCVAEAYMEPRTKRWYGSYGAYTAKYTPIKECDGVTNVSIEEGRQHFKTAAGAIGFINKENSENKKPVLDYTFNEFLYSNDGIIFDFYSQTNSGGYLNINIWQLVIDGEKPVNLSGANGNIFIE